MNVVVLDDKIEIVNFVGEILNDIGVEKEKIFMFTDVNELEKKSVFRNIDILFIDIKLDKINGIDYVKKNKKIFKNTKIIYITAFDDYIEDTFETDFVYFLKKPLTSEKIKKAYEKSLSIINEENKYLVVINQKGMRKIYINDIYYIESEGRLINFHLKKDYISTYKKLSEVEEELGNFFIKCHKSYLVNIKKIENYSLARVTLDNGITIPISRSNQKKCKQIVFKYLNGEEDE